MKTCLKKILILCLYLQPHTLLADIQVAISVTWEGEDLKKTNLEAVEKIRKQFPDMPVLHFLSSDYYSPKKNESASDVTNKIQNAIKAHDSIGLRIHGSEHLTRKAGVRQIKGPTFWGECELKCGRSVPLDAWSSKEIQKLIATSQQELHLHGFNIGPWFLAPGWLATPKVLAAARAQGYHHDFSAIPPTLLSEELAHFPLLTWLQQLWASQTAFSQPKQLPTTHGWIKEMGQNLGTMDYRTMASVLKTFESYTKLQQMTPHKNYFIHLGMYQETALHTAPKITATLKRMIKIAQNNNVHMKFYKPKGKVLSTVHSQKNDNPALTNNDRHPPLSRH
ncbi:MAG: hypothetical protein AB8C84_11040 [Oligoflexales bacterium]